MTSEEKQQTETNDALEQEQTSQKKSRKNHWGIYKNGLQIWLRAALW